jgi:short-subunit dehydrogenase
MDLSIFSSVVEFSETFKREKMPLDILVYNAGIASNNYERRGDGFERMCVPVYCVGLF